jgi:hypothetical protein
MTFVRIIQDVGLLERRNGRIEATPDVQRLLQELGVIRVNEEVVEQPWGNFTHLLNPKPAHKAHLLRRSVARQSPRRLLAASASGMESQRFQTATPRLAAILVRYRRAWL